MTSPVIVKSAQPIAKGPASPSFPMAEVENILREELAAAVTAEALVLGVQLPAVAQDIGQMPFELDSLVALETLCALEPLVGFDLPSHVVQAGGYTSIDHAVTSLVPGIEKQWKKHNGVKT